MEKTKGKLRAILDTNIIISGLIYGGVPGKILSEVLNHRITGIISSALLAELEDVLKFKFPNTGDEVELVRHNLQLNLVTVHTYKHLKVVKDEPDNRVLETTLAGKAHCIVTGDKELLALKKFRSIKIITPREFLEEMS